MTQPADSKHGRDRILTAALPLFARRGFESVTIRDIGAAAGLTNPALYRHFADKEALGIELYRQCYRQMLDAIEAACAGLDAPLDQIEAYVGAVTDLFEREPDLVLYVDEHQVRFWPKIRGEFDGRTLSRKVEGWIVSARASGALVANRDPPMQVAMVMGFVSHWFAMRAAGLIAPAQPRALAAFIRQALTGNTP